jgi:hypothetical protein
VRTLTKEKTRGIGAEMRFPECAVAACTVTDRKCNEDMRIGNNRDPWVTTVCVQTGRNRMLYVYKLEGTECHGCPKKVERIIM